MNAPDRRPEDGVSSSHGWAASGARILLLVNRHSGAGCPSDEQVTGWFTSQGLQVESLFADDPSEITETLRSSGPKAALVVLGGGDGTVSQAAGALLEVDRPILLLPMGTANDLARSLELPLVPEVAAVLAREGRLRRIDVGTVNGRPFFNVVSVGLSTEVARAHTGPIKKWLKTFGYAVSWVLAYRRHRPFLMTIRCDDTSISARCTQAAVANGKHHGAGLTVSEDASIDDGLLDVYYIEAVGAWKLLTMLRALRRGKLRQERKAEVFRCRKVELKTEPPCEINADGELVGQTPASVAVKRNALSFVVPRR